MFTAVAFGSGARDFVPFGPDFATEEAAWHWVHFDMKCAPVHVMLDVWTTEETREYLLDVEGVSTEELVPNADGGPVW